MTHMPKPYTPNDKWSQKAAAEGYRARSVYKLMELDERFRLIKQGMTVLDLGAAPGSWMQYTLQKIGSKGRIIGFDLQEMAPLAENVSMHTTDITDRSMIETILKREGVDEVDLVLSDIAPNTSGIKDVDQWRSVELATAVFQIAHAHLSPRGNCVVKVFRGADFDEFLAKIRGQWHQVGIKTVKVTRDRSREVYMIATK